MLRTSTASRERYISSIKRLFPLTAGGASCLYSDKNMHAYNVI